MKITLTADEVRQFARDYEPDKREAAIDELGGRLGTAGSRGYLTRQDLIEAVSRVSPKDQDRIRQNTEEEVREISRASFSAITDRLRIGALMALEGVAERAGGVILYFAFPDEYPRLNDAVRNAVSAESSYSIDLWMEHTRTCREKAEDLGVSLLDLDEAVRQWARTNKSSMVSRERT